MKAATAAGLALAGLLTLAACSSGSEGSGVGEAVSLIGAQVQALRGKDTGAQITATDAQLRAFPQDLLLVSVPDKKVSAGLVRRNVNRDTVTWVTPDGVTVVLRQGQVVRTSGFGNDLSSGQMDDIRKGRGGTVRDYYYLGGDETVKRVRLTCDLATRGAQRVVVAGLAHAATLIEERCTDAAGASIVNRYWVEAGGLIRKSVQFVSPGIGYVTVEDVHGGGVRR